MDASSIPYRKISFVWISTTKAASNHVLGISSSQEPTPVSRSGKEHPIEETEVASNFNVADKRKDRPDWSTVPADVASFN